MGRVCNACVSLQPDKAGFATTTAQREYESPMGGIERHLVSGLSFTCSWSLYQQRNATQANMYQQRDAKQAGCHQVVPQLAAFAKVQALAGPPCPFHVTVRVSPSKDTPGANFFKKNAFVSSNTWIFAPLGKSTV
jgi:hypothetical protein